MFADRAKIIIRSGKGGDGHVSFRRELYVPNGGPDGGDGGRGGDVIFEVDKGQNTLGDYRHKRKFKAQDGEEGGKKRISNFACGVIATVVALVIFSVAGYFWVASNPFQGMFVTSSGSTEETGATQSTASQSEDFTYPQNSQYFRVRNFVGMRYEDVEKLAENSTEYYVLRTTEDEFSDTVAEGYIISQTPEGNTTVDRGNDGVTISVTVSKGPQTRELPEVENLTLDDAAKVLNGEHFVANTQLEFSDEVPENTVIGYAQGFEEGQKLDYGSEVTIIVSLGPEPDLSSQSGASAAAA